MHPLGQHPQQVAVEPLRVYVEQVVHAARPRRLRVDRVEVTPEAAHSGHPLGDIAHGLALAQRRLGLAPLGHVEDDRVEHDPAVELDRPRVHLHVTHRPVDPAVAEVEAATPPRDRLLHLGVYLRRRQGVDVGDVHGQELVAAPPVPDARRVVGVHEGAAHRVHEQHDGLVLLEQAAVAGLALSQPSLSADPPCEIPDYRRHVLLVAHLPLRERELDGELAPVPAESLKLDDGAEHASLGAFTEPREQAGMLLPVALRRDHRDGAADGLGLCEPEDALRTGVPRGDDAVEVRRDDRVRGGIDQRPVLCLRHPGGPVERPAHGRLF